MPNNSTCSAFKPTKSPPHICSPDEETTVQQEHQRAANAARLLELSQTALAALDGDDSSLLNQTGALGRTLQELRRLDPSAAELVSRPRTGRHPASRTSRQSFPLR